MIVNVALEKIEANPWQTRLGTPDPEYIRELAESIKKDGLLQMPGGRLVDDDGILLPDSSERAQAWLTNDERTRVQLSFGHNRLRAFRLLIEEEDTWATMPVVIQVLSDEQMATSAWAENEKRRDHTPLERAIAIERRLNDFRWTHEKVAEELGISRSAVTNALRLLKLPDDLRDDLQTGKITERQAVALLPLFDMDAEMGRRHGFDGSVAVIVALARNGASSDDLRQRVTNAVDWLKEKIQPSMMPVQQPAVSNQPAAGSVQQPGRKDAEAFRVVDAAFKAPEPKLRTDPRYAHTPAEVPEPETDNDGEEASSEQPPVVSEQSTSVGQEQAQPAKALSWEESTITVTISWWAGVDGKRPVMLGGRVNQAAPVMRFITEEDITGSLKEMIEQLKQGFGAAI